MGPGHASRDTKGAPGSPATEAGSMPGGQLGMTSPEGSLEERSLGVVCIAVEGPRLRAAAVQVERLGLGHRMDCSDQAVVAEMTWVLVVGGNGR